MNVNSLWHWPSPRRKIWHVVRGSISLFEGGKITEIERTVLIREGQVRACQAERTDINNETFPMTKLSK